MFHRSWGIMMIQHNISAPCTVLDFPDRRAFAKELKRHSYDIVGISSIIVNVGKVREMCRMVRRISPRSVVVVGGHVAAISGLPDLIDADHIVRGDGISWMRRYLGESDTAPIRHPPIPSGLDLRVMGFRVPASTRSTAATLIPAVGCPMGCNFCTTSAFFGGKGKFLDFYHSSDEVFAVMEEMESKMKVRSFFIMDENFLLRRQRTMELLARMKEKAKNWSFYVFSSVNAIRKYSMEELVELGVSWLWLGLESPRSGYAKLQGTDTQQLARELRAHGIKLLGSTIVGLEHHTPQNIGKEIDYAVAHETDFHQFMLYTPMPGTPLYREMEQQGRLLPVDPADTHGQYRFNFKHAAISRKESTGFLEQAFRKDFEQNGPQCGAVGHGAPSAIDERGHQRTDQRFAARDRDGVWWVGALGGEDLRTPVGLDDQARGEATGPRPHPRTADVSGSRELESPRVAPGGWTSACIGRVVIIGRNPTCLSISSSEIQQAQRSWADTLQPCRQAAHHWLSWQ
jgi:hypothetical protein